MSTMPALNFGVLLRRARRAAGWTQEELAARAGLSVDTISVLERGRTRAPHPATVDLLAGALALAPGERAQWVRATQGLRLPGVAAPDDPMPMGNAGSGLTAYPPVESGPDGLQPTDPPPVIRRPLPPPATPLIGREQEVRALCALLQRSTVRLLTVTGSAGVGKTRLAFQVATELGAMFAAGVQWIALDAVQDPTLVLPTLARALGLPGASTRPVLSLLADALHEQQMLLVLDNFEQVIAAAPDLAALLAVCPAVKLLVTSREVLHLRAEQQFVVPPLALRALPPPTARQPPDSATLAASPAVQLFLQRVQATQPDFQLTPGNAATLAAICQRLEGLPLAIELAAPRLKLLSPPALLARLDEQLPVLTGGARDLPARQRTMRATLAWSYDLLAPAEQALFRRLAVFAGGWMLAAAEQVCRGAGPLALDILEGLGSLLDKSLLRQEPGRNGELRFRMLAVVREFGREQLDAAGEGAPTRAAHAAYYFALVEKADPQGPGTARPGERAWREAEHDNLRVALDWGLEQPDARAAERALHFWWVFSPFWGESCYRAGSASVQQVLAGRAGLALPDQVKALLYAAAVLQAEDAGAQATALLQEALALARQIGDGASMAWALRSLRGVSGAQE